MARVLIIGGGDSGMQIARGLLQQGGIERLTVADQNAARCADKLALLDCCFDALVRFEEVDGLDPRAFECLLRRVEADVIVQCASLISPWSIIGRDHPMARAIMAAGIAIQLPAQLPILRNLMEAVRNLDIAAPVANLSMPDISHRVLQTRGLAPTIGLGNASILLLRAKAELKARMAVPSDAPGTPLVRVTGHHRQVYDVMQARMPADIHQRVWVHVGEAGERSEELAYGGTAFPPGPLYNVIAAQSSVPVVRALLPGAKALRFSAPAPQGLPGGYPVRIEDGTVGLDLPADVTLEKAVAYNQRLGALDGIGDVAADGMVRFSDAACTVLRDLAPELAEPLNPWNLGSRTEKLLDCVRAIT